MGGKVSKARRACTTETNTTASLSKSLDAGYTRNRKVDTECVQDILNGGQK